MFEVMKMSFEGTGTLVVGNTKKVIEGKVFYEGVFQHTELPIENKILLYSHDAK